MLVSPHLVQRHFHNLTQQPSPQILRAHLSSHLISDLPSQITNQLSPQIVIPQSSVTQALHTISSTQMAPITSQISHEVGPPIHSFPVTSLEERVNITEKGKKRKVPVNLDECKLMQLVQYDCRVEKGTDGAKKREVQCRPLLRLFRQ